MLNVKQFREDLLLPTLSKIQMFSDDAVELLVFTCAVESNGGSFLKQVEGPAMGAYQMESETHHDLWINYLLGDARLLSKLSLNFQIGTMPMPDKLMFDIQYATLMARFQYSRWPEPLPDRKDVEAMFEYYKKYYNTSKGKATKAESIKKYNAFIKNC